MSDEELRELERRSQQSGAVADRARYLAARVREGLMAVEALEAAAYLGDPGAAKALEQAVAADHSRSGRISDVAGLLGHDDLLRWGQACDLRARTLLDGRASSLRALRQVLDPKILTRRELTGALPRTIARVAAEIANKSPQAKAGWELDELLTLLLELPSSHPFAAGWREQRSSFVPFRLVSWIASYGGGCNVHVDSGVDDFIGRLKHERGMGLATFRKRLDQVRAHPGAWTIRGLEPPAIPADLEALEARSGRLPEGYRQFLLEVGRAGQGPNRLWPATHILELLPDTSDPQAPFPWSGLERSPKLFSGCPNGAIPIALGGHGGTIWTLLVTSGPERGRVWGGVQGMTQGAGEPCVPLTRGRVAQRVLTEDSLPIDDPAANEPLSFEAWYGEWLALYCAALP